MGGLLSYRQGKSFSHCSNLPQSRHISCHIQRGNFFLQFLLLYGSQILQYWEDVIRMITIQKILITRKATRRGQKKVTDRDRFTSISIYAVKYFAQPHLYSTKPVLKHSSSLFTCHAEKHSKHSKKKRVTVLWKTGSIILTDISSILTVAMLDVQTLIHSPEETDRNESCRHTTLLFHA